MGTFDITFGYRTKIMKTEPKSSKDSGLPSFQLKGGWNDNNEYDTRGISFDITPKKTINKSKSSGLFKEEVQPKGGVQLSTGWFNKDVLEKGGADTIMGMSKQVDQFGNTTRGVNYANPNFYAYEEGKKKEKMLDVLYKQTDGLIGKESTSSGSNKPSGNKPSQAVKDATSAGVRKRNAMRREARWQNFELQTKHSPLVAQANTILKDLGRPQITAYQKQYGYGSRFTMELTQDPTTVIKDYYNKKSLIEWAKDIDPEHAKIDPKRIVSVVDTSTTKSVPIYWTHNNNKRITGYRDVTTNTYKDVLATSRPKGETMDMLYTKVMNKSKQKKKKYETYFKTDPKVDDYQYYTITDDDFASHEQYKQDLISSIGSRRSNQKQIIDKLKLDTKTIDKKDRSKHLIPTLETATETLDTKANILKDQVDEYNWQKNISQESFGTDTIQGDSHVRTVLDSYGGKVRGGAYYSQDVGKLVKRTKAYETELESQIKQKEYEIKNIELDKTDGLVDYYNETSDKEYATASKDYLSKSLTLTKKERDELERARKQQVFSENQSARQYTPQSSRGKPSLKDVSRRQYKNTRTRGGKNTLGGLVI